MLVFFDHTPLPYNNCIIKGNNEKTWQLLAVEKSYQTREDDGNDARNTRARNADTNEVCPVRSFIQDCFVCDDWFVGFAG